MTRSFALVIYTNSLDSFTGEETNWEFIYSVTVQENYVSPSVKSSQKLNGMASGWCVWFQCSQQNHHLITERMCKEIATNCINLKMKITILPTLWWCEVAQFRSLFKIVNLECIRSGRVILIWLQYISVVQLKYRERRWSEQTCCGRLMLRSGCCLTTAVSFSIAWLAFIHTGDPICPFCSQDLAALLYSHCSCLSRKSVLEHEKADTSQLSQEML